MQAWEQFLVEQEKDLGPETVRKWLRSLKVQRFDACNLYLEAKDAFQIVWFEEHMRPKVIKSLVNGNYSRIKVHLLLANQAASEQKESKKNQKKGPAKGLTAEASSPLVFDALDPNAKFEHFCVTEENSISFDIVLQMARKEPGKQPFSFNPVFLYGPTGCGKTHLMMALTHELRTQGINSVYIRSELFTEHVLKAIRAGEMSVFRHTYRTADVLLVDDVQHFSKKGATQEEFFHTFNTLHLAGKQIVLSANCLPRELLFIEPRLISRFEWGIVLPLKPLGEEGCREMLRIKSEAFHFPLSDKTIGLLSQTFTSNQKALVVAFEALMLRLHLEKSPIAPSLFPQKAKALLADLIAQEAGVAVTPAKIIKAAADYYRIRSEDILGKSKMRTCSLPRQLAMHFCRERLRLSYIKIGELFSRNHSTVMSSVKYVEKSLKDGMARVVEAWRFIDSKLH